MSELGRYPKQVFWSNEDEGFIALAPDLPGCSAFGETESDALGELDDAICAWLSAAKAAGNPIPAPSNPASRYSGKLLVRMPKSLHEQLAHSAERESVSLNHYIVYLLSYNYGKQQQLSGTTSVSLINAGNYYGFNAGVLGIGTVVAAYGFSNLPAGMTLTPTGSVFETQSNEVSPSTGVVSIVDFGKATSELRDRLARQRAV